MDNNNQNQPPQIPESEMKLPEEQFGDSAPAPEAGARTFSVVLVVLLVVLLAVLAAVIVWGEEILDLILPDTTMELPPLPEPEAGDATTEAEIEEIEAELEEAELEEFDAELAAIEAELEAELSATTTIE